LIPPFSSTSADFALAYEALASDEETFYMKPTPTKWEKQERGIQLLRFDFILPAFNKDGGSHNWDGRLWGHRNLAKNQSGSYGPISGIATNVYTMNINERKNTVQAGLAL
jgi:hypothetical protein